jgi:hypothetical protein
MNQNMATCLSVGSYFDAITWVSLIKTPSQLESMVQEAKLLRKIVEGESDVCELDEKWHGIYDII